MEALRFLVLFLSTAASAREPGPLIIDPGHGGEDMGAVVRGLQEKDLALAIARRLRQKLAPSVEARLTRDSDVYVPLDRRIDDNLDGALFVSLHVDKVRHQRARGIRVFAYGREFFRSRSRHLGLPALPPPPKSLVRRSRELADRLAGSLRSRGLRVLAPERASFYVLKNPQIPSVLIELGYLSNPEERAKLGDPAYQDLLAETLAATLTTSLALDDAQAARGGGAHAR